MLSTLLLKGSMPALSFITVVGPFITVSCCGHELLSEHLMSVCICQGGYRVAVVLSFGSFIAACRLFLYSATAPSAWLHFAGRAFLAIEMLVTWYCHAICSV